MRLQRAFLALLAALPAALALAPAGVAAAPRVLVAKFENDINPVTTEYLEGEIARAEDDGFSALVVELDTPGGLSSSMREMVKAILASKVPVVVYVSPPGSSADSAGAVITMAADVAAMAPQTNIGSSTPISIGGEDISKDLRRKVVNDAAAYIRELAIEHGRNPKEAERFVRVASNLGAREALRRNVVDVSAPDLATLLRRIDGRVTKPKGLRLDTGPSPEIVRVDMSGWKKILDVLIDPNIVALMLSLGALGIVVELWNPGLIFPGTVGGISLILGLFGLSVLPISWAGLLMMLLAAGFFVADLFVPSHGALTLAGAVTFVLGSLLLFDPAGPAYQVSLPVALAIAGTIAAFMAFALTKTVQARRQPVAVGTSSMVGTTGIVRRDGYVFAHGELWRARNVDQGELRAGEAVEVEAVEDGLVLAVRHLGSTA